MAHIDSEREAAFDLDLARRIALSLGLRHTWLCSNGVVAVCAALVCWGPLVMFLPLGAASAGAPWRVGTIDPAALCRFLIAVPCLVASQAWCLRQLHAITQQFVTSGLIADSDRDKHTALLVSARRRLLSPAALLAVIGSACVATAALAYAASHGEFRWNIVSSINSSWLARYWQTMVSFPILLGLLFGWLWRWFVWAVYLVQVARLDLRLTAPHPDRMGGLGFVVASLRAFSPVAFALAAIVTGSLANQAQYEPATLLALNLRIAIVVVLVCALFGAPLLAFSVRLFQARERAALAYGTLVQRFSQCFEQKWLTSGTSEERFAPDKLAVSDFSSAKALLSVAGRVQSMRLIAADPRGFAPLVIATVLPFVPLVIVNMPDEKIKELFVRMLSVI